MSTLYKRFFDIVYDAGEVIEWLEGLSTEQLREYLRIELAYVESGISGYRTHSEICRDWMEENGGERDWWFAFEVKTGIVNLNPCELEKLFDAEIVEEEKEISNVETTDS